MKNKIVSKFLLIITLALVLSFLSGLFIPTTSLQRVSGECHDYDKPLQWNSEDIFKRTTCWGPGKSYGYPFAYKELTLASSNDYEINWTNFTKNSLFYFLLIYTILGILTELKILKKKNK